MRDQPDLFAPPSRERSRRCRHCGVCDPLPAGVSWVNRNTCSECDRSDYPPVARGAHETEPCPIPRCTGWRHPLAAMCNGCKTLLPRELHQKLLQASLAKRHPHIATQYGPFDLPTLEKAAIEAATK